MAYKMLDKDLLGSVLTLTPGSDGCKPTLKSSTATNEILSVALCCKPLHDGAQHLSMLVTMKPEVRQKCWSEMFGFTQRNQREAVEA